MLNSQDWFTRKVKSVATGMSCHIKPSDSCHGFRIIQNTCHSNNDSCHSNNDSCHVSHSEDDSCHMQSRRGGHC